MGQNRPYLDAIVTATFQEGSEDLSYKTYFDGPEKQVSFLKNTFDMNKNYGEAQKRLEESIQKKKKQIIENLVPLMPSNRQTFFGMNYKMTRKFAVYNHLFDFLKSIFHFCLGVSISN